MVFFALHAPHRGKDSQEIAKWWADTETILYRASNSKLLLVGADCNASLGSVESVHVSSCGSEEQDQSGDLLHSCLHKCGLWAPATFADVQSGPTWTFVQRRNGATTRPDFVFLPLAWRASLIRAWTNPEVVAANMVMDHLATIVDARVTARGPGAGRLQRSPRIDIRALTDPSNREQISQILEDAPRPAWEVSAHSHVAIVTSYLQERRTAAFPQQASRPFQAYLTADTWALQKQVAWLRRKCASVKTALRGQTLRAVFHAWQRGGHTEVGATSSWLREWQVADALYGFRLGVFAKLLRHRCKADRVAYVASLADSVQANERTAFQAVNQLLGRRRKKPFAPAVLPVVQQQNGAPCPTPDAATKRWREHFSALEDGEEVTCAQLVEAAYKDAGRAWPSPASISDIPTPLDLQRALLAAKRGKACGPRRHTRGARLALCNGHAEAVISFGAQARSPRGGLRTQKRDLNVALEGPRLKNGLCLV